MKNKIWKMAKMTTNIYDSEVTSVILKLISHTTKNTLHDNVTRTQKEATDKRGKYGHWT